MKTGTGSYGLDILVLLALIIGSVWYGLWFVTSPIQAQHLVLARAASLTTVLLAQPGLIGGMKLLMDQRMPVRRRLALGGGILLIAGVLVPVAIGNALLA